MSFGVFNMVERVERMNFSKLNKASELTVNLFMDRTNGQ
jgi:hypothetical protein